jgi:hypothetical protein
MQSFYFKKTITIMLRKSRKKNYFKSLFFKLIALLNILNKILKLIILKRLRYVIKTYNTLLRTQIKIRKQRLINTTLQLITKKIYTIYSDQKKKITFLLNFDILNAFDNVSHIRLLYNIKKR